MSESDLTPRQTQILRLIQDTLQETGMPPTRKEIAEQGAQPDQTGPVA